MFRYLFVKYFEDFFTSCIIKMLNKLNLTNNIQ